MTLEHYPGMIEKVLATIATDIAACWDLRGKVLWTSDRIDKLDIYRKLGVADSPLRGYRPRNAGATPDPVPRSCRPGDLDRRGFDREGDSDRGQLPPRRIRACK